MHIWFTGIKIRMDFSNFYMKSKLIIVAVSVYIHISESLYHVLLCTHVLYTARYVIDKYSSIHGHTLEISDLWCGGGGNEVLEILMFKLVDLFMYVLTLSGIIRVLQFHR
jgi:hypothetical protein